MPKSSKGYSRTDRVNDAIQRELAILIREELQGADLGMITVSRVKVSPDFSNAEVYVTVYKPTDEMQEAINESAHKEIIQVLNDKAGFLRTLLAQAAQMRVTPKLRFHYGNSIARGRYLSSLIDQAVAADKHRDSSQDDN